MKRVLIVEDEIIIGLALKKQLEKLQYEVYDIISSAEDALDVLNNISLDLIFMDIKIEGKMDGIDIINAIRKKNILTSVIFLTGNSDNKTVKRVEAVGSSAFLLVKPVTEEELQTALKLFFKEVS
jgi:CheY-like chemotaxis protein